MLLLVHVVAFEGIHPRKRHTLMHLFLFSFNIITCSFCKIQKLFACVTQKKKII